MADQMYTTQLQAGLGLVQETSVLLDLWEPGDTASQLCDRALESGQFPTVTARRLRNIVAECFAPRYLNPVENVAWRLKQLKAVLSGADFRQLLLLHTARANKILADFVRDVYWERYAGGYDYVTSEDAEDFVRHALDEGKTEKYWADSTVKRVCSYLLGACSDYDLLGDRTGSGRIITAGRLSSVTAAYLAYDLNDQGMADNVMAAHPDWKLFGLDEQSVRGELKNLSLQGLIVLQAAGDIVHISWRYSSMEELIDGLSARAA
jgi:hypothetical protein